MFYFHRFRLQVKFIGKYLLKSSYPLDYTPLQHPDARTTPVRGIHDAIDRPIIVRLRHCGPGDRSPAKMRALIRVLTPSAYPLLPTSTTTLSRRPPHRRRAHGQRRRARRVVFIDRGHVVRPSNRRHHRHWCRISDVEPRQRPPELAETRNCTGRCPTHPRPSLYSGRRGSLVFCLRFHENWVRRLVGALLQGLIRFSTAYRGRYASHDDHDPLPAIQALLYRRRAHGQRRRARRVVCINSSNQFAYSSKFQMSWRRRR